VTYSDVGQCKGNGLDIESLDFKPMPEIIPDIASASTASSPTTKKGLSIAEAKEGLSAFFGVPVESVQITISG
jgi:hypothetical protein